jgi:hypothetical protein
MKLKKLVLASLLVIFIISPGFSSSNVKRDKKRIPTPTETADAIRAQELLNRLEEIKAMDVASMTKAEKRELRKEVKAIKKEMREINDGGVYISVGGIIIILLLLILLL